jgi:hypothetical protein
MKRVLIANRGEIAVRVIRACKDHGLESVAVYSDEDRTSLHAQMADTAYSLHGVTATQTYLDIDKLIAIAKNLGQMPYTLVMVSFRKMQTLLKLFLMQVLHGSGHLRRLFVH